MEWWFSYLEKLVRKLFNCCHVACGEKNNNWINFQLTTAAKETEHSLEYNCIRLTLDLLFLSF